MRESINKLPRPFSIGLIFPLIFLNIWLLLIVAEQLQPLLTIFVTATLIAFLLDYPIRFLQQLGLKRGWAVGLVLIAFLMSLITLGLVLGPLIFQQANELINRLPEWLKSGQQQLLSLQNWAIERQLPIDLSSNITQLIERLSVTVRSLSSQLVSIIFSTIGSIINIFLTLVFAIFLALRGGSVWEGILSWLPSQWSDQIRKALPQNFEVYIVGQFILALILGVAQTTAFALLGVPLSLLFGSVIAVASLIPFGGTVSIVTVSLLIALQNFWLGVKVLTVALIIAQINDNLLAPRIVGDLVGLNPVWMLISLSIGVKLGGFIGLLVAVPIASFIKITFDTIRASWSSIQVVPIPEEIAPIAEGKDE